MKTYPLCLVGLEKRRAVVVGGGVVAARKTEALLQGGAQVTVISPEFCHELNQLFEYDPSVDRLSRCYQPGDLDGAWIVIAATDSADVNRQVSEEARDHGCLVNVVDDPEHSNFILPAVVRRGEVILAISTGGASPALARHLREKLEDLIGSEYGDLAALMAELRPELIRRYPEAGVRSEIAVRLIDSDLLEIIRTEGIDLARETAAELLQSARKEQG